MLYCAETFRRVQNNKKIKTNRDRLHGDTQMKCLWVKIVSWYTQLISVQENILQIRVFTLQTLMPAILLLTNTFELTDITCMYKVIHIS